MVLFITSIVIYVKDPNCRNSLLAMPLGNDTVAGGVDGTGDGGMAGHPAMWLERFQHASLLLTAGASPMTAQRQFRQSDPLTVLRNYAHIIGTEQRQAAERVADILRPTSATFENQLVAVQ